MLSFISGNFLYYSCKLGAEKEWNLAQHNMETAANGLFSAANQLHIASVKANSASGQSVFHMQEMRS